MNQNLLEVIFNKNNMKNKNKKMKERLKVRITNTNNWYKKDEIHEVCNYVTFAYVGKNAAFEVDKGVYGIDLKDCIVLAKTGSVKEYTMDELTKVLGHNFKIKDNTHER